MFDQWSRRSARPARPFIILCTLAALALAPSGAAAQEARGTIQGRVVDASGAVVPGATVEVLNIATGVVTPTTSNEEGNYRVPFLNPGTYRVTVTLDGLQQVRQRQHRAARRRRAHRRRHAAGRRESPTRSRSRATAATVDRIDRRARPGRRRAPDRRAADSRRHRGRARHSRAGRAEHDRPALAQGRLQQRPVAVVERRRRREAERLHHRRRGERRRRSRRLQPAVGGGRGVQDPDDVLRRGGRQHDGRVGQPRDQERHQHPARAGLRVVPRRRPRRARTTSTRRPDRPKRDYKDNRFGAAVGGPIAREPDVLLRQRRGQPVPGAVAEHRDRADREDAHRRLLGAARARPAVSDLRSRDDPAAPDAGRPLHPRSVPGQHHPGRTASARSRRTSSASIPLPNQAGTADGANNYTNPTAVAFETYYTATARVDHNLSARHRIYGRFSWDFWEEEKDDRFDNIATGIFLNRKNRVFAIDDAYTIKNNLLMNVRGGFTRQLFPERRRSQGFDLSSLGFSPTRWSRWCRRTRDLPERHLRRLPGLRAVGVGRRLLHHRRLQRHRQPHVAGRQPQHEVRHRVPPLRRGLEPLPDRRVAARSRSATPGRAGRSTTPRPRRRGQDFASFLLGLPTGGTMSRPAEYTREERRARRSTRTTTGACATT